MIKNSFFEAKADVRLNGDKDLTVMDVIVFPESVEIKHGGTFIQVESENGGEPFSIRLTQLNGLKEKERKLIERIKKEKYKKRKKKNTKKIETCFRR